MQLVHVTERHAVLTRLFSLVLLAFVGIGGWARPAVAQNFSPAKTAIEGRDYDKAITALRAILQKKPKSAEGHYLLGLALKGKGRTDEALAEFQEAVHRKKKYPDALYESGILQTEQKRYAEAEATLAAGEQYSKGKEPRFFYAQGVLKAAQGALGEATRLMSKAIAQDPKNATYLRGLGDIYMKRKVWGIAINEYNKALALDPDSPDAALTHKRLGELHFKSRQFEKSIEEYKKAAALDPKMAEAWYQQGYIFYLAKQYGVAVAPLEKSVALQPEHFESNHYLALSLNKTKRLREAVPYFEKALQLNPEATDCYPGLADGYLAEAGPLAQSDSPDDLVHMRVLYKKAVDAYKHAVEKAPDDPDLVYSLGWVESQEAVADYEDAIRNLKRAIELNPSSHKPYLQLAIVYFGQKKYADAIPPLKKAIELDPEDQNPYAYLGRSYIKQGRYAEAVAEVSKMLNPVIARHDNPARLSNVYFTLGQELYKEKQYLEAIHMYQQKVAVDTTSYATYLNMGLSGLVGKEFEVAKDAFLKAVALKQGGPDSLAILQPLRFLGMTYLSMNDNASGKEAYRKILELDPRNDDALYRLGVFSLIEKRFGAAEKDLKKAIALKPDNASYHLALAQTYTNSQRFNQAVREYRTVIKLDPNNTTAQKQLHTVLEALKAQG